MFIRVPFPFNSELFNVSEFSKIDNFFNFVFNWSWYWHSDSSRGLSFHWRVTRFPLICTFWGFWRWRSWCSKSGRWFRSLKCCFGRYTLRWRGYKNIFRFEIELNRFIRNAACSWRVPLTEIIGKLNFNFIIEENVSRRLSRFVKGWLMGTDCLNNDIVRVGLVIKKVWKMKNKNWRRFNCDLTIGVFS